MATVPLFVHLHEHHCIGPCSPAVTGGKHDGFDDGLANAWLPMTRISKSDVRPFPAYLYRDLLSDHPFFFSLSLHGKVIITASRLHQFMYETFVKGEPNSHNEKTCTAYMRSTREDNTCKRSAALVEIPAIDLEIEDIFASCELGPMMACMKICVVLIAKRCVCILWPSAELYGRVRRWDDLITLTNFCMFSSLPACRSYSFYLLRRHFPSQRHITDTNSPT